MTLSRLVLNVGLVLLLLASPLALSAETNCDAGAGPLRPDQPSGITAQDIIQKFAAREAIFKQARNNYTFTQDVVVQQLEGNSVTGEFRLVQDITYDDKGNRIENVKFAPQSSLTQISLSREDYEDFRNQMPFVMTTEDLPNYNLLYVGQQHVDEIDTYVFDVAPKTIEKGQRYFQGRLWVDNHDLQIVKTCGQTVPQAHAETTGKKKKKNVQENLTPKFVTYREQIDGQYWFPTYTSADDVLHFATNDVHIKEVIKYTNYQRFGVKTKITYGKEADQQSKPPAK
ncbi:MAG TPA: hypothetical protein VLN58_08510 [Verrucomicrobiae bacterium]|nr:hypothetical protein [Verrucomicrobiae bacterium]